MTPSTTPSLTLIERADWNLVGGSVGFHCPECGAMIWNSVQFISNLGMTRLRRECPAPRCDWRGKVRLEGWDE